MDELSPLTPAEERLLKAVREDEECNLADGSYLVQSDETSDWGKDRTVRAELLQQLMHNRHLTEYVEAIDLRAARIVGDLRSSGLDEVVPIALIDCRMDGILCNGAYFGGDVNFHGTTFTGEVKFDDAIFAGEARFDAVTFEDAAGFLSSTFRKDAKFGRATFSDHVMFGGADFHGATDFEGAKFATVAWFIQTTFTDTSTFQGVRFDHFASFEDAIFGRLADFRGATFGGAVFTRAIFTEDARFDRARFSGAVQFLDATFAHDQVYFDEVTFTDTAQFTGAIAREWNLRSTKFLASDPGPWTGIKVDLSNAVLHESSNIFLTAREVIARRLQSRESVHLEVHTESLDLSDAEFLRHSILSVPPPSTRRIPHRPPDSKGQISFRRRSTATDPDRASDARTEARNEAKVLAGQLANEVGLSKLPARCGVTSLSRANVGELVIAGTAMDSCSFSGAHGLDTLTISEDCTFQRTKWSLQRPTQFTRRRVIAEEVLWRQQHGHFWGAQGTPPNAPSAHIVSSIYRDLRKGLEDTKNEPGAADFYYGEMEMRRVARRGSRTGTPSDFRSDSTALTESALLHAYWAVSGYGLRAWRAIATLVFVLLTAAGLFTSTTFATRTPPLPQIESIQPITGTATYSTPPPITAPSFPEALEFAARESISLLQIRTSASVTTTGPGTVVDFILRLAGPVLLALTVLALRGRTKR